MAEQLPAPPTRVFTRISAEPVHNALNSMALLSALDRMPALDAWVAATAAALTDEQRERNRLVFEYLHGALLLDGEWPDVPAYLTSLAAHPADDLRDRAARTADSARLPDAARALLEEPAALRELIVAHLRELWDQHVAAEWMRSSQRLQNYANTLAGAGAHTNATPEQIAANLWTYIATDLGDEIAGLRELVFVPSPHTGRYITRQRAGETLRLFFDAPRHFAALLRGTSIGQAELLSRLNALNDKTRLQILSLFTTQDVITAQDVMERIGLTQSTTSRYLKELSVFLMETRGRDGKKTYRLMPTQIDLTFQALRQSIAQTPPPAIPAEQTYPRELRRFLDEQGRLTTWPARDRDKELVITYLASRFERGRTYTEKEVNTLLAAHMHPSYQDFVSMRRELYDRGYLDRERDGSRYWRAERD